ncbi:hypothetical protein [Saccharibacillus sp. O23]|uniref:hypothetical protein n=1 Tax=Saccharibacillus sp. O23 TaxID=2009338 RepID=UPI00117AFBDC|nr:hypothetical protein [Saccharibacillus sp. O23]
MDRVAWILNLREPFGAALGRELVSRGWNVIGGDPEASDPGASARTEDTTDAPDRGRAEDGGKRSLSDWLRQDQASNEAGAACDNRPAAYGEIEGSGGETDGPKIGENSQVPTGTGTSGLNDFEGSVAFGPETNERRTDEDSAAADIFAGEAGQGRAGNERAADTAAAEAGAPLGAGAFAEEAGGPGSDGPRSDGASGGPASAAAPLPGHGRLRAVPLDASRPGALEQAARLTAELAGRIDLLVLNAGEPGPARGEALPAAAAESAPRDHAPGRLGGTQSAALEGAPASGSAGANPAEPWSSPFDGADTTEGRLRDYATYALTPLQAAERLLPLMEAAGGLKRICFVSSHEGSVSAGDASAPIGRAMARTALHMQAKLLFNDLRREGYTFRLYDPGLSPLRSAAPIGREAGGSAAAAGDAMASLPSLTAESARFAAGFFANPHADEGRLVLTGSRGEEWPF